MNKPIMLLRMEATRHVLLKQVMALEKKSSCCQTVMGTKEKLMTIRAEKDGLLIETMYFAEEIKVMPNPTGNTAVNEKELEMAKILINHMTAVFNPEIYYNEYTVRLKGSIIKNNSEIIRPQTESVVPIADLMGVSTEYR